MQCLSTADVDSFICPFAHCVFLFAVATLIRKTFISDRCQTNAPVEALYDCTHSLALYWLPVR